MKPFNGTFSDDSLLFLIIRPFAILMNPAVLWAVITLAFPVLWVVGISFVIAQIFASPPYLLTTAQLGYLSAGPVVGGTLGCLFVGWISDPIVKLIARKNGGVYEPEFRLVLVLGLFIFSALGYFLFGNLIVEGKSAVGMAAIWAVIIVTVQFVGIVVGTYMVDAYRDIAVEVFIIAMIFKNFLFFGFSC
jgi:MFS family permease